MKLLTILFALVAMSCAAPAAAPASSSASASAASPSSSTPTARATSSGTATPQPSGAATDPARYGYIVPSAGKFVVRPERTADAVISAGGEQPVASHDGKRIAFWRSQELRIVDVPGGAERVVTTIPATPMVGGVIAWANDDTGLLFEIHDPTPAGPGPGSGPASSELMSWDLSATQAQGATTSELRLTNGAVFIPLAWDKVGQIAGALTTGEGGYAIDYYAWSHKVQPAGASPVTRTKFPWQLIYGTVRASHDARRVLAVDGGANVLRVWPIATIATSDAVTPAGRLVDAKWRPGSSAADIGWVIDSNVAVFTYQGSSVGPMIYRGQSFVAIIAWRADGSGFVVNDQAKGIFAVELPSGQATQLNGFGPVIAGAVLLR